MAERMFHIFNPHPQDIHIYSEQFKAEVKVLADIDLMTSQRAGSLRKVGTIPYPANHWTNDAENEPRNMK